MPETDSARPLISFADEGKSAVVERSLPEPIAYRGRSLIELRLASTDAERREVFTDLAFEVPAEPDPPPAGRPVIAGDVDLVYEALGGSGGGGAIPLPLPDPPLPDAPSGSGEGGVMHSPGPRSTETVVAERYRVLAADAVAAGQRHGGRRGETATGGRSPAGSGMRTPRGRSSQECESMTRPG